MRIALIGAGSTRLGAALAATLHVEHIHDVRDAMSDGFILDGVPRDVAEAELLDANLRTRAAELDAVLWLPQVLSADGLLDHYAGRIVQLEAGATLDDALDGLRESLLV